MKTTINQLVQELKDIQDSHLQLNDFFWGDFGKASSRNDLKYPLMCCYYPNGSVLNNLTPINLIVVIADKIDKANNEIGENPTQGNLTEVESDTLQVTRDIYNVINKSRRWQQLARVNSVTFNKFIERGKDETAGHYMTISLYIKDTTSICNLPMEGYNFDQTIPGPVDCDPATVQNSDDSYSVQVSSGGTLTLPDEDITINGSAFLTKASVKSQDIDLQDQDANPITPSSIVGNIVTVTLPAGQSFLAKPIKTGQNISFATGDDADLPYGREDDPLTLSVNNPAGNTYRFTDTLLGQTFTSGVAIDWAYRDDINKLVVGWQVGDNGSNINWNDAIDYCISLILDTYTDWNLPNSNLIDTLKSTIYSRTLNYIPFLVTGNVSFWSSSTLEGVLTTYAPNLPNRLYGTLGAVPKTSTSGMRAKAYRVYTYAELGL